MTNKLRVAVIYGGPSREHEVSIKTGRAMIDGLSTDRYNVVTVFISKENKWQIDSGDFLEQGEAIDHISELVDICLIGLHGTFGEDGQIQALLEAKGIAFTGSNSDASKLAMQKHLANQLLADNDINLPSEITVERWNDSILPTIENDFGYPVVVKPEAQGSSVGVTIVDDPSSVEEAVNRALNEDSTVLIQQFISGREVSCGVLDIDGVLQPLPPTEVMPLTSRFYDYSAKYDVGATKEITPPENMEKSVISQIQALAIKAHEVLKCSGYSRTDMIINKGTIYVIETNTLPGMTVTSFLPQQVKAIGMPFSELLDIIIKAGLRKQEQHV